MTLAGGDGGRGGGGRAAAAYTGGMAIVCPRCGREYDATLFEFDRVVACDCGERISRDRSGGARQRPGEPRFLADAMLGRLARWLRYLGYDTAYDARAGDAALAGRALREGRTLLTRDHGLLERWPLSGAVLVESDRPSDQLRQVVNTLDLAWRGRERTRCTVCNGILRPLPAEEARDRVPAFVFATRDRFTRCPDCGRIYWEGTHAARMREALELILPRS